MEIKKTEVLVPREIPNRQGRIDHWVFTCEIETVGGVIVGARILHGTSEGRGGEYVVGAARLPELIGSTEITAILTRGIYYSGIPARDDDDDVTAEDEADVQANLAFDWWRDSRIV